jgi:hypothetical protein
VEIDEMAYISLLLWIPSRQQFVGDVDFGGVFIDGDIKELLNEDSEEDETYEDDFIHAPNNGT